MWLFYRLLPTALTSRVGSSLGKKVQIRKPAPGLSDVAPSRRTSRPVIISSTALKKSAAQQRPLRERLTHLLALKPYRKPELILRLQKDGLSQADKETLDSHLQQVCSRPGIIHGWGGYRLCIATHLLCCLRPGYGTWLCSILS